MIHADLKFAIVREDHRVEEALVRQFGVRRLLTVASGGCTALNLSALHPELDIVLVDINPAQLAHVHRKMEILAVQDAPILRRLFNVEDASPGGLNACGAFEALFRSFRRFVEDFILPADRLRAAFADDGALRAARAEMTASRYWPVAFEMHFGEPLLLAMFGPDAVQHAERGSYPGYFRRVFEQGMERPEAADNPFLQHVLLGCTLARGGAVPPYLRAPGSIRPMAMVAGSFADCRGLDGYDLVGLSNVMDWMDESAIGRLADDLGRRLRPGAVVLWRQLNNPKRLEAAFREHFDFDSALAARLHAADRSLFYTSLHVGVRRS